MKMPFKVVLKMKDRFMKIVREITHAADPDAGHFNPGVKPLDELLKERGLAPISEWNFGDDPLKDITEEGD